MYTANESRYEKMQYNRCGASGLKLPAVSLGLWHNFGDTGNYENMKSMCFTAFDNGITHFDLANNYGPAEGSAEANFGKILKEEMWAYRDEMIISTKAGYYIRKYKLDELPQLWNVLIGDMSLVGPRPEVERYVRLYTPSQRVVLSVKPGITDYASIAFSEENVILGKAKNPEKMYIEQIMPKKIEINLQYINNRNLKEYFKIIFLTFVKIIKH